ncbi:hypothetical protein JHK82_026700 [Glycine max]|nr:hypothetical protein JHK85_027318 [Glycine max]KAG5002681.1 hypothetical protein JHK86_026820 [Glycine max]KAG5125865.1 hypothetical protein JHK82_026700 [Glycine max]
MPMMNNIIQERVKDTVIKLPTKEEALNQFSLFPTSLKGFKESKGFAIFARLGPQTTITFILCEEVRKHAGLKAI